MSDSKYVRVKVGTTASSGWLVPMGLRGEVVRENTHQTLVKFDGLSAWLRNSALEPWEPCHSCEMLRVNGTVTHEIGCPDAWKDELRSCKECGQKFFPTERYQDCCNHICMVTYHNFSCECEICQEPVKEESL